MQRGSRQMGEEQSVFILTVTQVYIPNMVRTYQEECNIPEIRYICYKLTLFIAYVWLKT
jgi:hypothetical protein